MSLQSDLLQAVSKSETGLRRCSVCDALRRLEGDDEVSLRAALTSKIGAKKLSVILQNNGIAVGVPSIHSHRSEGHQ